MTQKRFLLTTAAAGAALLLAGCRNEVVAAKERLTVRGYTVAAESVRTELRYAATVEPSAQVTLAFRTPGIVVSLYGVRGSGGAWRTVEPGDYVPAGTVLARLRATEYRARMDAAEAQIADAEAARSSAEAQLAEAQAAFDQATLDHQRAVSLLSVQAMTKAEYDAVKSRLDGSAARVRASEASIHSIGAKVRAAQASTRESQVTLGDTALVAPFGGFLVTRRVERGGLVDAAVPAFTLANLKPVKIAFGVPDSVLREFGPGTQVRVAAEALPGREFVGRVQSVSPAADAVTRAFRVEAIVDNPQADLKAGMIASVSRDASVVAAQILVPLSALIRLNDAGTEFGVFALDASSVVKRRRIDLGVPQGERVIVRAGLSAGERIVRDGVARLSDGDTVQVLP